MENDHEWLQVEKGLSRNVRELISENTKKEVIGKENNRTWKVGT